MNVFYGAAIQGNSAQGSRQHVNKSLVHAIRNEGCRVLIEHTTGSDYEERMKLLSEELGALPQKGIERTRFVRNRMIEFIERQAEAAIFELSVPSLGTGIEIAHAYLRPRLGLAAIPILFLYEKDFWPNNLSSMVRGLDRETSSTSQLFEYTTVLQAIGFVKKFISAIRTAG